MAYVHLTPQDTLGTAAAASVNATYPSATTQGNLLIATAYSSGLTLGIPAISGWTLAVNESFLSLADNSTIFYRIADGTETTITATCTSASNMALAIHEFWTVNIQAVQPILDQTSTSTVGLATSITLGPLAPTKPNQLVIMASVFPSGGTSAWALTTGTIMSSNANMTDGFFVNPSTVSGSVTVSWTGLSTAGGCIASFFVGSQGDTMFRHIQADNGISVNEVAN